MYLGLLHQHITYSAESIHHPDQQCAVTHLHSLAVGTIVAVTQKPADTSGPSQHAASRACANNPKQFPSPIGTTLDRHPQLHNSKPPGVHAINARVGNPKTPTAATHHSVAICQIEHNAEHNEQRT